MSTPSRKAQEPLSGPWGSNPPGPSLHRLDYLGKLTREKSSPQGEWKMQWLCLGRPGAIAQSPGREAALAWASLAQRFPASSILARAGAGCGSVGEVTGAWLAPRGLQ